MEFWAPNNLQQITGGRWLTPPPSGLAVRGLSIDSRTIEANQVFLAVEGQRFDGHDFLAPAAKAGAGLLIVSRHDRVPLGEVAVLQVDDSVKALHDLAQTYRDLLKTAKTKVIAVVGSNGKTTTRHLIHAVLSAKFRGTQSPKSFNNHLGLPLTLLAASPADDFVVAELGTNHPGEIETLAKLARPDAAVIPNLDEEHLEFFADLAGVVEEEAAVLKWIPKGGPAFLEARAFATLQLCNRLPDDLQAMVYGCGPDDRCQITWSDRELIDGGHGQAFGVNGGLKIKLPLLGRHNVDNAVAAVAVGRWLEVPDLHIASVLKNVKGVPMRLQVQRCGDPSRPEQQIMVVNDAYNANYPSMVEALRTLASMPLANPANRRIAILGDMLELGPAGPQRHRDLVHHLAIECKNRERLAARCSQPTEPGEDGGSNPAVFLQDGTALPSPPLPGIAKAILIGPLAGLTAEALQHHWSADRIHAFHDWTDHLPGTVANLLRPGDVVLIKGSRGMGLERLIPAIEKRMQKR